VDTERQITDILKLIQEFGVRKFYSCSDVCFNKSDIRAAPRI
jgi:hypothetical protein